MSLYDIKFRFACLMDAIEDADGEIDEFTNKELDNLVEKRDEFIESICKKVRNKQSDITAVNAEIERLEGLKQSHEKNVTQLKKLIIDVLHHFEMKSPNKKSKGYAFKSPLFSIFTVVKDTITFDEVRLSEFDIDGKKSKYIKFAHTSKVDQESANNLLKTGTCTKEDFKIVLDKTSAKEYIKSLDGGDIKFDYAETAIDPISELVVRGTTESLTIK